MACANAADLTITSVTPTGELTWTNAFTNGVCTVETLSGLTPTNAWVPQANYFTTNQAGRAQLPATTNNCFVRLLSVDISTNSPRAFSNLVHSYGVLCTIAGNGAGGVDGTNYWQAEFEGGFATNATLSRPHFAQADDAGNVFIVDKDSHSLLKVTPDGRIHTVAGTHVPGDGADDTTNGTSVQLKFPNGLWVRGDGTAYVLDTDNAKVRRLDTNGMMSTLFKVSSGITGGRGLWVSDDESVTYFCSGSDLRKRVPGDITTLNSKFTDLGNIVVNPAGDIIATDRGDHKVFLVDATGINLGGRTRLFGDGSTNSVMGGTLARTNGLYGVRGVWLLPNGGYVLATHEGSQVLYVDPAGIIQVLVDGQYGGSHSGDGEWFYSPGFKITEVRSVSMDGRGNILIVENDVGYVRKIEFQRLSP